MKKYKFLEKSNVDIALNNTLCMEAIANELAELNRIKRLVARREYLQAAYRGLFKIYKDDKGVEHQIPPSDEDKESYTKDVKAIAKQFLDHATDKE